MYKNFVQNLLNIRNNHMAFLFWILIWSKVMNLHLHISIAHTPEIQTVWLQVAHSAFRTADSQHVPPPFYFLLEGGVIIIANTEKATMSPAVIWLFLPSGKTSLLEICST